MFLLRSFELYLLATFILLTAKTQRSTIIVSIGDDVTLPCKVVKGLQDNCFSTIWIYADSDKSVTLFEYGMIHKAAGDKSDRLRVTEECSLVLKKVTAEDEGVYICRQFRSGEKVTDSVVQLSVNIRASTATKMTTIPPPPSTTFTSARNDDTGLWWRRVYVPVGVAALSIIVVSVHIWTKTNGKKTDHNKTVISDEDDGDDDVVTYENTEALPASVQSTDQ